MNNQSDESILIKYKDEIDLFRQGEQLMKTNIPEKMTEGIGLLRLAAAHNFPPALYYLGKIFEDGLGIEENEYVAMQYYVRAAKLNHCRALARLGLYYENDDHDQLNYDKALLFYYQAIKYGSIEAYFRIYVIYRNTTDDDDEHSFTYAIKHLVFAADHGIMYAQICLAKLYFEGKTFLQKNDTMAQRYFLLAAETDNADALFALGEFYRKSNEYYDKEKAYLYFLKAKTNTTDLTLKQKCSLSIKLLHIDN